MIPESFAIFGALLASIGGFFYLYETLLCKSQPNRVTWFLWGLFPMIAFVSQRSQDVGVLAWVTFISGFTPVLVFIGSFLNKKAYWKTTKLDYLLFVTAIVAIVMWGVADNPNMAILLAIIADFLAATPTLIKSYKHPESESWIAYGLSAVGFGLGVLSIQEYTFQNFAFVIYLFVMNSALAILSARSRKPTLHLEP